MKKLIVFASAAILAGCSQTADDETVAETPETTAPEPAPMLAADGQPAPGMY